MLRDPRFEGFTLGQLTRRQTLLQTLYETRVASLQRLVSFMVIFHAMGKAVEDWWRCASLGLFAYDCWRSQSRMRIATTASPVSGSEVRERTLKLAKDSSRTWAEAHIAAAVRAHVSRWRIRIAERGRFMCGAGSSAASSSAASAALASSSDAAAGFAGDALPVRNNLGPERACNISELVGARESPSLPGGGEMPGYTRRRRASTQW